MNRRRTIAVLLLALGVALGSIVGMALLTQQAFAQPCPMHDQGADRDCCKGDCSGAMVRCSVKCAVPFGTVALTDGAVLLRFGAQPAATSRAPNYNPFETGPPAPVPII